jgi:peroxiredoxin/uncharacterized membrane protein YphA (DoxX/SURF4 family)
MELFLLIVRIVLAAIFALAGVGKLLDLKGSKKAVQDFGVPENLAKPFGVVLPLAEILISVLLLFVQTSWLGAIGAVLLLAIFIGGMIVQMIKGNAPDCHCFGQIHSEPVSAKSLLRNAVFAILALFLVVSGKENQGLSLFSSSDTVEEGNFMQFIFGLTIIGLLGGVVYLLKQISDQQLQIMRRIEILELTATDGGKSVERENVSQPEKGLLIGMPAPDFELPDLDGKNVSFENLSAAKKPILFFFVSPTCNPCGALLPEIETWQEQLKDKFKFVFISNGKAKDNAEKLGGKTLKQVLLQKDREVAEQFGALWTPAALLVNSDGTIASHVAAGDTAIRELIEKIKTESAEKDIFYLTNGKEKNSPNLGEDVPEFSLEDVSGNAVSSKDLRGKKTLLTYWSIGCGYCTQMLEELRDWDKTKGQDEPNLLLLSSGDKEKNLELDLQSPIVLDDERKVAQKLGMNGTPSAVLINENGKIISEVAVGAQQIWALIGKRK